MNEVEAEILTAGTFNGNRTVTVTDADLDVMIANWRKLSAGGTGGMTVNAVLGHKGFDDSDAQPSVGRVVNLFRRGRVLVAKLAAVPTVVAEAIRRKLFSTVSCEFYENVETTPHARLAPGARGKALSRIAILGATVAACRGLKDLEVLLASEGITPAMLAADDTDDALVLTFSEPLVLGDDPAADATVLRFAEAAHSMGFDLKGMSAAERQQVLAVIYARERSGWYDNERKETTMTDNLSDLGARLRADTIAFAEDHNLDLHDPQQRRTAEGGAGDGAASQALRDFYRSPLERRDPVQAVALAEQQNALEVAVIRKCSELGLCSENPTDRAVALGELGRDPRYRGTVVPDYATGNRR